MPDPISTNPHEAGVFGLKFTLLIAGFLGGVVSLSFVKELTRTQAALSVFTGAVTAGYGAPLAVSYMNIASLEAQNGLAFVIGLTAMNIIPAFMRLSEQFKRDPRGFLNGGGK